MEITNLNKTALLIQKSWGKKELFVKKVQSKKTLFKSINKI